MIGSLPGADRQEWLARYGQVTGPLNAKGVLVTVDGEPVPLSMRSFDLVVEDHPRYTFHLTGRVPARGSAAGSRHELRFERGDQPAWRFAAWRAWWSKAIECPAT